MNVQMRRSVQRVEALSSLPLVLLSKLQVPLILATSMQTVLFPPPNNRAGILYHVKITASLTLSEYLHNR
jgi:hypothetical protein